MSEAVPGFSARSGVSDHDHANHNNGIVSSMVQAPAMPLVQNVSQHLEIEGAFAESESRFRATFDQAAVGIAHVGLDGRWLLVNQRLCDIVGYQLPELLARSFQDITHPDDLDTDLDLLHQVLADEIQTYGLEKRYVRKDGCLVWINLTVSLVRDDDKHPKYFISVVEDIDRRKQAELEVRALTEELERRVDERTRALVYQTARANSKAEQSAYLAELSHQLESISSPRALMDEVVRRLRPLIDADTVSVLVGRLEHGLYPVAFAGQTPEQLKPFETRPFTRQDGGALWSHLPAMSAMYTDDYASEPLASPVLKTGGVASTAWVPFGEPGGELGIIAVLRYGTPRPWLDEQKDLLAASAGTLAISLQRAARIQAALDTARYAQALLEVSRLAETTRELEDMAAEVIKVIAGIADVDLGGLVVTRGDLMVTQAVWESKAIEPALETMMARSIPRKASLVWAVIEQGDPVYVDDYIGHALANPALIGAGIRSTAIVPLTSGVSGMAFFAARVGRPRAWTEQDRSLFEAAARSVRLALAAREYQRILEAETAFAQSQAAYAHTLLEVSKLADLDLELDELGRQVTRLVSRASDVDFAGLGRVRGSLIVTEDIWSSTRATEELKALFARGLPNDPALTSPILQQSEPRFVDDYLSDPYAREALVNLGVRSTAVVPLIPGEGGLSFFALRLETPRPWTDEDRELFLSAARALRGAVAQREYTRALEVAAFTDVLTGLRNRRAFDLDLDAELSAAQRHGFSLSIVMMDVDGLKGVNDSEGHERGDALLKAVADGLVVHLRREDRLYRLGGDEFAAILSHTPSIEVSWVALGERVRRGVMAVREAGFKGIDVSVGMAGFPAEASSAGDLVRLADERMYVEKMRHRASLLLDKNE